MYDPPSGSDYEFIELHNISSVQALNLEGANFTAGVDFTFPTGTPIPPGGYLLVIRNADASAFRAHYSLAPNVPVSGPYSGSLANGGEQLTLKTGAGGTEIVSFEFGNGRRLAHRRKRVGPFTRARESDRHRAGHRRVGLSRQLACEHIHQWLTRSGRPRRAGADRVAQRNCRAHGLHQRRAAGIRFQRLARTLQCNWRQRGPDQLVSERRSRESRQVEHSSHCHRGAQLDQFRRSHRLSTVRLRVASASTRRASKSCFPICPALRLIAWWMPSSSRGSRMMHRSVAIPTVDHSPLQWRARAMAPIRSRPARIGYHRNHVSSTRPRHERQHARRIRGDLQPDRVTDHIAGCRRHLAIGWRYRFHLSTGHDSSGWRCAPGREF